MPEGHTIHRLARDLRRDLAGTAVSTDARQERFAAAARSLDGAVLTGAEAYGKHLFVHFGEAGTVHVHLGLFGRFQRCSPDSEPSPALRLRLAGERRTWDLTGAITCELRDTDIVEEVAASLGPDPIRPGADPEPFLARMLASRAAVGKLLVDQAVIAGIGNVYRAELAFLAGLHPRREGRSLHDRDARALWDLAVEHLRRGVKYNRIITVPPDGKPWSRVTRAEALWVYKRRRCRRCGSEIDWFDLANRTAYACPVDQR